MRRDARLDRGHYSDEEREFLVAMDRYKRTKRRPFPTCCEILAIIRALGYRKVAALQSPLDATSPPQYT